MSKKVLIIVGDPSGDRYGELLIKSLKKSMPQVRLYALGGRMMESAGVDLLYNLVDIAVMGFSEVIKNLCEIRMVFKKVKSFLETERPDAVVLVDYPGFNLKVAEAAHGMGIPVIYYISPQVWSWWQSRIHKITYLVKKILVILPFEEDLYKKVGADVLYVGHPLMEILKPATDIDTVYTELNIDAGNPVIGMLPGSRKQEIDRLLPVMLKAGRIILEEFPDVQFILPLSSNIHRRYIEKYLDDAGEMNYRVTVVRDGEYRARCIMNFALVASGTATLENAILGIPMIIMYKMSFFSYLLAKRLVKIPNIGLVNIIAGKKIVPEFIQYEAEPEKIADVARQWLKNPSHLTIIRQKLSIIKDTLGTRNATNNVTNVIGEVIGEHV